MAGNKFRKIQTYAQLQQARKSLDAEVKRQADQLWIPYAIAVLKAIRAALRKKND